jgi:NTE family protein
MGRIGLVLGAGGVAGGAFHAGVLSALAASGWDPRDAAVIVGTSAGSITGASLRAGFAAGDMLARAQDRPLSPEGQRLVRSMGPAPSFPSLRPAREARPPADVLRTLARAARRPFAARPLALAAALLPEGSLSTDMISGTIGALVPPAWPSRPLWLCAVRQSDGRRIVFGKDGRTAPVPDAVAASCAIPGFFRPVEIGGEAHLDGGVHSPTNADVMLEAGELDLVIVSSPMSRQGRRPRLALDQAMRVWASAVLDAEARQLRRRGIPVLGFQPDETVLAEMGLNALDPSRRSAIAAAAHESARRRLARADVASRLEALTS